MNKRFTNMNNFFNEDEKDRIQCPVCGEMFKPAPEHAYHIGKNKKDLCCSWTCMRNWEKHKTVVTSRKRDAKRIPVRIVETGETFRSIKECSDHLQTTYPNVYRALMSGYLCKGYHIEEIREEVKK